MEPVKTRVMERTEVLAKNEMYSLSHDRRRSISPILRSSSVSGSNLSDKRDRAGRCRHKSEIKKCRPDRSRTIISPQHVNDKLRKNTSESSQASAVDDKREPGTSSTDASNSSDENHNRRKMKTRDGKVTLSLIHVFNYGFMIAVDFRTYRLADSILNTPE